MVGLFGSLVRFVRWLVDFIGLLVSLGGCFVARLFGCLLAWLVGLAGRLLVE